MKKQITGTLNKLFAFVALATILTGSVFARSESEQTKSRAMTNSMTVKGVVTPANRLNYIIGQDFAYAVFDAPNMDKDVNSLNYTIVDLVYLIDDLEGQPETAQLQNTLKSIVRRTKKGEQIRQEIETIFNGYLARQKAEQKWYFNIGQTITSLNLSSHANNNAVVQKELSNLKTLMKTAPQGTPQELVAQVNSLVKFSTKTTFTKEDFTAISQGVKIVTNTIYA